MTVNTGKPVNSTETINITGEHLTIRSYIRNQFETETSLQGIPHVLKHKFRCMAIFWIIIVLCGFGALIFQICKLSGDFFSYPVDTVYQGVDENPIFPDVTVCNLYPLTTDFKDAVQSNLTWYEYKRIMMDSRDILDKFVNVSELPYLEFSDDPEENRKYLNQTVYDQVFSPPMYFANLHFPNVGEKHSRNKTNMIRDCEYFFEWENKYYSTSCEETGFINIIWNSDFYMCYTFKLPDEYRHRTQGLSMFLYIDNFPLSRIDTISSDFTPQGTGVRVVVHSPGTFPNFHSGINVGPGTSTTIQTSMTNRTRLDKPYRDEGCSGKKYLTNSTDYRYSRDGCLDICKQQLHIDKCKCLDPDWHFTSDQMKEVGGKICGNMSLLEEERAIEAGLNDSFCYYTYEDTFECNLECLQPCFETIYETSVSSAPWPHLSRQLHFYLMYIFNEGLANEQKFDSYGDINDDLEDCENETCEQDAMDKLKGITKDRIEDHFLKIDVVLEPHTFVMKDTPKLPWESYLAELGGALGIWLGITAITVVEFIDMVITSAFICCSRKINNREEMRSADTDAGNSES